MVNGIEIFTDNVNDNEWVNYRIVLIKGYIRENNQYIKNTSALIKCKSNGIVSEWPIYKGNFKCLAYLNLGNNRIILEYENVIKQVNIRFNVHETDLCVCPVYLVPKGHDGKFQAPTNSDNSIESALARISLGIQLIQCIFGEKLKERGFQRKSFQIENDLCSNVPMCRLFYSKLNIEDAKRLKEEELWETIGRELMLSNLGSEKRKYLCFISSTYWDGEKTITDPALGGGGLALLGSASLHAWPSHLMSLVSAFQDSRKLDPLLLDNSCYRGTYGGVLSTSLGSACHELGHAFNLGHPRSGLMSRGFDHTGLVFIASPSPPVEKKREESVDLVPCLDMVEGTARPRSKARTTGVPPSLPDLTYLAPGCAAILAYHPWFNPGPHEPSRIHYDQLRKVVQSEAGLRVVQIRDPHGIVLRSWELRGSGRHLVLSYDGRCSGAMILAVDARGGILSVPF